MSRIGVLYKKIEDITSELAKITVKESDINLIRLKAEITAALAMLNNLRNNALSRYNLVSDIRYTYTAILIDIKFDRKHINRLQKLLICYILITLNCKRYYVAYFLVPQIPSRYVR